MTVGRHGRLTYRKGTVDLSKLLDEQSIPRSAGGKENMLVTGKLVSLLSHTRLMIPVSANEQVRDELQELVQSRLDKVTMLELDYQPAENRRFWNSLWKRKTGA